MIKFPIIRSKEEFDEHFQSQIWLDAAKQICRRHQISFAALKRAENGEHIVFLIDDLLVIKIYRPLRRCFEREKKALEFVNETSDLRRYALPLKPEAVDFSLEELEKAIWSFTE